MGLKPKYILSKNNFKKKSDKLKSDSNVVIETK